MNTVIESISPEVSDATLYQLRTNVEGRIRILQKSKDRERNKVAMSELSRQLHCVNKEIDRRVTQAKRAKWNVFMPQAQA